MIYRELKPINILDKFPNPELINNSKAIKPSRRLGEVLLKTKYNKVIHGVLLAEEIGLDRMRAKNKGFNDWISKLEKIQ
ncbi:MAG: DUF4276 family protein [Flavobacteriaceae bacterium]|nr:DUF4276 family protein [Flavobacteriaceae bacterium]